ncbi:pyocin knob domain-containing protein [Nesterenkonia rhizosphaerae]|uniref:Uncharacterized protein n=1 Tax=Nesterenkonia rhizosphaerae TaxID=1348272 RepID=A0ABP9FSV8_9MICC
MAQEQTSRLGLDTYTSGNDPHPTREEFNARMELLDRLAAITDQGVFADRPAPETSGRLYWATDRRRLFYDTGTAWEEVNTTGSGGVGQAIAVGASVGTEGTSERAARADHTHPLPLVTSTRHGAMSSSDKALLDGATASLEPSAIVRRNASGQASIADPTAGTHAATKSYVDAQIASHSHSASDITSGVLSQARLPNASSSTAGIISPAHHQLLAGATSNSTASTVAMRDASGRLATQDPNVGTHAANKQYVDAQIASHSHAAGDITSGTFAPARLPAATSSAQGALSAAHYRLLDGAAYTNAGRSNIVMRDASGHLSVLDPVSTFHPANKAYVDAQVATRAASSHNHAASNITSGTLAPARLPAATRTAQGAIPAAYFAMLADASWNGGGDTLVRRGATTRRIEVGDPTAPDDAATKRYVDAQIATRAASSHNHAAGNITSGTLALARIPNMPTSKITSGTFAPARLPAATSSAQGALSAAHFALLNGASTTAGSGNNLVMRASNGQFTVGTPTSSTHVATKGYVDSEIVAQTVNWRGNVTTRLNNLTNAGFYHIPSANTDNPVGTQGMLLVLTGEGSQGFVTQLFMSFARNNLYYRTFHTQGWNGWRALLP